MNVETEQIDVVEDACCGCESLTSASAALRISAIQIFAVCMSTISDGIAAWDGDAASVCTYLATVVVLPWITSLMVRYGSLKHAKARRSWLLELQVVSAAWVEQRALCEGGWWTWVFLVQLTNWEPTLVPSADGNLGAEANSASIAFAWFGLILFAVSFAFYWEVHELMLSCLRGNSTTYMLHRHAAKTKTKPHKKQHRKP